MIKKIIIVLGFRFFLVTCNSTTTPAAINDYIETGPVDGVLVPSPFSKGVNFSGWFDAASAQGISFTVYTEQDFINAKSLGVDIIRLPVKFHSMTGGEPDYTLDPLLFRFLDIAVDWAEKHGIYIIIDNHSLHDGGITGDNVDEILLPVWAQVARHYKDRSDYVLYEIMNEPYGISDKRWGEIQGMAIETIRRYDGKHTIIVGGTEYNSVGKLSYIPEYTDRNLIYTFHFYDPLIFTHQGAIWASPLEHLSGLPFPAARRRMPRINSRLRGTWVENAMLNYLKEADYSKLLDTLNRVVAFSRERDVPVFCGEFGVYMLTSPVDDRVRWYEFVSRAMDSRNIPRTSWDYYGGFGIFNTGGRGDFNSDLNTGVVRAMGFTPPPQIPRIVEKRRSGFTLYDDFPGEENSIGHWGNNADFSLYDINSAEGEFAIRWGNASQHDGFWFWFDRNGDFSELASAGYCLEFLARADKPVRFDVRFLNPDDASSIPWRMSYTIDESVLPPDGMWHIVRIPFNDMREQGAWSHVRQEWFNPRGEFSWDQITQLGFAAETNALPGCQIWFDNIKITEH